METNNKIGIGIVTYNRENYFKKSFKTIPVDKIQHVVVVNDGTPYSDDLYPNKDNFTLIQHKTNKGVGISKNDATKLLLEKGCDYIFLIEDDILIKDESVFQRYIDASKGTGIQHFNYSQHGLMNKMFRSETPNPRTVISYSEDLSIALYPHCVGAFSFYTRKCLEEVGLIDELFFNACEHVEHTYRIIQKGMHPPFWYFADIANSNQYLEDIPWTLQTSTISSRSDHQTIVRAADEIFVKKHGTVPGGIPDTPLDLVKKSLKEIYKQNG
jgi:GT2 family glycosyltransferase